MTNDGAIYKSEQGHEVKVCFCMGPATGEKLCPCVLNQLKASGQDFWEQGLRALEGLPPLEIHLYGKPSGKETNI